MWLIRARDDARGFIDNNLAEVVSICIIIGNMFDLWNRNDNGVVVVEDINGDVCI